MQIKKFVSILLICVTFVSVIGSMSAIANTELEREKIKVGFPESYGFSIVNEDGSYDGFIYEYLMEISKYTGWEYEFIEGDMNDMLNKLIDGEIDILGGVLKHKSVEELVLYPEYSSGYTYATLNVLHNNPDIYSTDLNTLQDARVGVVSKAKERQKSLDQFLNINGIEVKKHYYDTQGAMIDALNNHEIDAILTSDVVELDGQRIVASFAQQPYYFVTSKGKSDVLIALNAALQRINTVDAEYATKIKNKHFPLYTDSSVFLTEKEKTFIKNIGSLAVSFDPNLPPMQYIDEDGNIAGIVESIYALISERTGLSFEFIPSASTDEIKNLIADDKIQLVGGVNNASDTNKILNIVETSPYLPLSMGYAMRKGVDIAALESPRIAVISDNSTTDLPPNSTVQTYTTAEECLTAVNKGQADYTHISSYIYDYYCKKNIYKHLSFAPIIGRNDSLSIGIIKPVSPELLTILNKAVNSISADDLQMILLKSTMNQDKAVSLGDFIEANPVMAASIFVITIAVLVLIFIYIGRVRKINKKRVYEIANIDDVTGFINFRRFKVVAEELLRSGNSYALVFFDINKFKIVNDIFGHEKGNEILRQIADILEEITGADELFARVNADNFNVLMRYETDQDIIRRISVLAERISKCIDGYHIELSFGIYKIGDDVDEVVAMSDRANLAKLTIKDRVDTFYAFFDENVRNAILQEKELENIMESALKNNEFMLYLQPKYDLNTEKVVGAEALVRWQNKDKGMIYPNDFIPLFEKNGFIKRLDKYMFEQVCEFLSKLSCPLPVISVNFSRVHLNNLNLVDELLEIVKLEGITTSAIEIELTETAIFNNQDRMIKAMTELKDAGFTLSIDDFGTGYSSLNTLKDLPVDAIKFDRGFLLESTNNLRGQNIISNLIRLTRSIGIVTVAEGVETIQQIEFLREAGCDIAQGYYYAKPMPAADFKALISDE